MRDTADGKLMGGGARPDERRLADKHLAPWLPSDRSALKTLHPVVPKLRLPPPAIRPPFINPHYPHYIQPAGVPKPSDRVVRARPLSERQG